MRKRIYGVEVEFGIFPIDLMKATNYTFGLIFKHSPLGPGMEAYIATKQHNLNVFLKNEARLYCDVGFHPEYASPETRQARDAVIWEKAGERILEDVASGINGEADVWKKLGGVTFIKNNCNPSGELSWGYHQNFLAERGCSTTFLARMLAPFFVSSYVWDGNGGTHISGNGTLTYFLSQRARIMTSFVGPHTTTGRSMISTRDEPLADPFKWQRLHVIAKDSHMSELVIYLDLALIGLIIEICEEEFLQKNKQGLGVPLDEMGGSVEREYFAMLKGLNQDLTLDHVFSVGGQKLRALDIQWKYLELMRRYEKSAGVNPETRDVLARFEALLTKIELAAGKDEPEFMLAEECDWAAKLVCIKTDAERYGYSLRSPAGTEIEIVKGGKALPTKLGDRVQFLDLKFHDVRRDRGLHYALEKRGKRTRLLEEEEIIQAKENPPRDTRAGWRGWWRRYAEEYGLLISHWDWVYVNAFIPDNYHGFATQGFKRLNHDPFASHHEAGRKIP